MFRFNNALRHAKRKLVFDVEGLRRLAAQSVGRSPTDVVNLSKLAEGGFNRTFLITLRDDFQMVARIPYQGHGVCPARYFDDSSLFFSVSCVLSVFHVGPPMDELGNETPVAFKDSDTNSRYG